MDIKGLPHVERYAVWDIEDTCIAFMKIHLPRHEDCQKHLVLKDNHIQTLKMSHIIYWSVHHATSSGYL